MSLATIVLIGSAFAIMPVKSKPPTEAATTQPLVLTKLLSASGNRIQTFKYDVYQAIAGLKGDIPGTDLTWDVYASYGRTLFNNLQQNDSSKVALASILNTHHNLHFYLDMMVKIREAIRFGKLERFRSDLQARLK